MCDDLVARGECVGLGGDDLAGDVDAGDDRVLANYPAFRRDRERVLVVDARILDANGDLTCREEGFVDGFGGDVDGAVAVAGDSDGTIEDRKSTRLNSSH